MAGKLMTLKEMGEYLRINRVTLNKLIQRDVIPALKVGKQWRFKKEEVDKWLHQQRLNKRQDKSPKREKRRERRFFSRIDAAFPVRLSVDDSSIGTPSILGETINISEGGVGLFLEKRLPISLRPTMRIDLSPRYPPLETRVQIIWSDSVVKDNRVRYGLRFLELEDRRLSILKKVLEDRDRIITASYLPERVVTNQEIIDAGLKTTAQALYRGLGVRERRAAAPDETGADMMAKVAEKILKKAGCLPQELDCIICSSDPGDAIAPEAAVAVQAKIGASCPAFGISMACTGWICGVDFALRRLAGGEKRILVLASSIAGSRLFYHNLMHRAIFGDGAGGILLESHHLDRFLAIGEIADGKYYSSIFAPYPWSIKPSDIPSEYNGSFYMNPDQKIFFSALDFYLPRFIKRILGEANIKLEDIDLFLLHYPSKPLFEHSLKLLGIPREKTFSKFNCYGNLVAAEMPVFLDEAINAGRVKKNSLILILPYGAGVTMGGLIMRY